MNIPKELKYTKTHEWVRLEKDGSITVGITDHAQEALGDMVFVENPQVGRKLSGNVECAVVESVKAASDVYSPVAGTITAANRSVEDKPEKLNQGAYEAWMFKMKPENPKDLDALLSAADYEKLVESEEH
jgi:glycine cleavage system H protein